MTTEDYLFKFRRAKKYETLEIMAARAERENPRNSAAINKAFCLRELEIQNKTGEPLPLIELRR